MLRRIAGGLGPLLIVVGGIFLGQGGGLIGGSFMTVLFPNRIHGVNPWCPG